MITIFGTTYFTIGAGLIVLALAAPLLFWFSLWLLRPNIEGKPRSTRWLAVGGTTLALLLLTAVGLFWDVYLIGQRAKGHCTETGLIVIRKISTNGMAGLTDIESYYPGTLEFVENSTNGKNYRYTMKNGHAHRTQVSELISDYQLVPESSPSNTAPDSIANKLSDHVEKIVNRTSGEVVGTIKAVAIHAGWLDSLVFRITGFTYKPWICGKNQDGEIVVGPERITHRDLVKAVVTAPTEPRTGKHENSRVLPSSVVQ